jgi:anti-sigma factor RsiW
MTAAPEPVGEDDLMAYVDGRLPPERTEAVRDYLAVHPDARERVSQYIDHRQALREAFEAQAAEPVPVRLRPTQLVARHPRGRQRRFIEVAAVLCLVMLGGLGGWVARAVLSGPSSSAALTSSIIDDAIAAHRTFAVEMRHPVEIDAHQDKHLVQWLSNRLDRPIVAPDLTAAGYRLMGGRLLPSESGPAAQLMYENNAGSRLTIYLRGGIAGEAKRFRNDRGLGAFYWSDEGLDCVVVGEVDREVLRQAATSAYEQIFPDAAKGEFSTEPEDKG